MINALKYAWHNHPRLTALGILSVSFVFAVIGFASLGAAFFWVINHG